MPEETPASRFGPLGPLLGLGELFDDVEQFSAVVAALAAELAEFERSGHRPRDGGQ